WRPTESPEPHHHRQRCRQVPAGGSTRSPAPDNGGGTNQSARRNCRADSLLLLPASHLPFLFFAPFLADVEIGAGPLAFAFLDQFAAGVVRFADLIGLALLPQLPPFLFEFVLVAVALHLRSSRSLYSCRPL